MRFAVFLFLLLFFLPIYSQKILLDKDITKAYKKVQGPNTKSFGQLYIGTGFIFSQSGENEIPVKNFSSKYSTFGYRQKFKIFSFYSVGFEAEYNLRQFNLKQSADKLFPDTVIHDKEKIKLHSAELAFYNRFNFDKRGNVIGKYIDIGAFIYYSFSTIHYTKDNFTDSEEEIDPESHAKVRIVKYSRLDYIEPFGYGVYAKAGIDWFAIKVTYRISDIFKDSYNWNELPGLSVGFEVSFPN